MTIRFLLILSLMASIAILAACDLRSGTAKEEMEKFNSAPTPPIVSQPTATPVDPADIVTADTSVDGSAIFANGDRLNKTVSCTKLNRIMVNGDENTITVKGVCRQIMINGDRNKITADASMEFVFNGSENTVKYSRLVNGKPPTVVENRTGNSIEKTAVETMTSGKPQNKIIK